LSKRNSQKMKLANLVFSGKKYVDVSENIALSVYF
jgi:hypothetical protein